MLVIEQTKEQPLKWQNINWTAVEGQVRRLQERIFRAAQNGEHARVKNLQKVMLQEFLPNLARPFRGSGKLEEYYGKATQNLVT